MDAQPILKANMPPTGGALSAMSVPENFPNIPIIAVNRNPVYPRFVKMIEVCEFYLLFIVNTYVGNGYF